MVNGFAIMSNTGLLSAHEKSLCCTKKRIHLANGVDNKIDNCCSLTQDLHFVCFYCIVTMLYYLQAWSNSIMSRLSKVMLSVAYHKFLGENTIVPPTQPIQVCGLMEL